MTVVGRGIIFWQQGSESRLISNFGRKNGSGQIKKNECLLNVMQL